VIVLDASQELDLGPSAPSAAMEGVRSPSRSPVRAALSLFFWLYFALTCIAFFLGALALWLVTRPFDRNGRALHLYSCFWAASYFYVNPLWHVRVAGQKVDRDRPFVIVANHQSFGDILALFATYLPFKWVSKASVFKVPFLGWNMRLNGYVPLTRGNRASVEKMSAACAAWIERGVSVLLFPEGTRSPDGELQAFKVGAFRIARDAGVPVLPIVVDGTADTLPKHGFVLRQPTRARVRVLDPIDVTGYPSPEAAALVVRDRMARELAEMRGRRYGLWQHPPGDTNCS
jgi:1-acyl-sn-glycerol-3-phosphate acyltransferase